jgi:hypothetical protein
MSVRKAKKLFEDFTGHQAEEQGEIFVPPIPESLVVVGPCDGILYETVRDGKKEKYIHTFKKTARPFLCSSPDGKQLLLVGGRYKFTETGINDLPVRRK